MFSGVIEVGHWLKLVKGCARYIFGSLFVKLGKMSFISFQVLFSFSRKSNFGILDIQVS